MFFVHVTACLPLSPDVASILEPLIFKGFSVACRAHCHRELSVLHQAGRFPCQQAQPQAGIGGNILFCITGEEL